MNVPLSKLHAEILNPSEFSSDWDGPSLRFQCPICEDPRHCWYVIPFKPGANTSSKERVWGGSMPLWGNPSGSTIEDLTLAPSILAQSGDDHRLHVFVRDGVVQVLSDSFSRRGK